MQPSTVPSGGPRTADDAAIDVMLRAHQALRRVENTLELEAGHPALRVLYSQAKALRKAVAVALAEISIPACHDCAECLVDDAHCEASASVGAGRCCDGCSHV